MQTALISILGTLLVIGLGALLFLLLRRGTPGTSAGTSLGPYRNLVLLSEKGGMAKVYFARNVDGDRDCVLKVLRQELLGDGDVVRKFRREAEILQQLKAEDPHAPVPIVYGAGAVSTGLVEIPFIEMEYIPGATHLGDELRRRGALNDHECSVVIVQVCRALRIAHSLGIVHRDLKPPNVLLADGRLESAVVIDFGVAKKVGGQSVTVGGYGTAAYMAPEQCGGLVQVSPAADVYGLGVLWYEMATGRKLYEDENPLVVMRRHQDEDAARLVQAHAPRSLHSVLARMLSRDPGSRPDVEEVISLLPAECRSVGGYVSKDGGSVPFRFKRGRTWTRSRLVGATGVLTVAVAVVLAYVWPRGGTGHTSTTSDLVVVSGLTGAPFQPLAQLKSGYLTLTTTPPGAQVFYAGGNLQDQIGRKLNDTTPMVRMPFPIGTHQLYLQLANHESRQVDLVIRPDQETTEQIVLTPGKGTLTVGTLPDGVQADLDDQLLSTKQVSGIPVSVGSHVLRFRSQRFQDQSLAFEITQVGQEVTLAMPTFSNRTGSVRIRSQPAGAALTWDGVSKGAVPAEGLLISGVGLGSHSVQVSVQGFHPWAGTVEVVEGTTREVTADLKSVPGRVRISASESASVVVRSAGSASSPWQPAGFTPITISLEPGRYQLELRTVGDRWQTTVAVANGQEVVVQHEFPKPGALTVTARGAWGNVLVNGVAKGMTPLTLNDVKPGTYEIEVGREGYRPFRETIVLGSGETKRVVATLK